MLSKFIFVRKSTSISTSTKYYSVITPKGLSLFASLRELFHYRQLLLSFAARDYKVRYAQTFIGYWWSLLQPIASVGVLFLVFQKVVKVPTSDIPYIPFALSGLVLWNYFNFVITQSAASLIVNQSMIRKIYFPRLCLPLSRALVGLIEPLIGVVMLLAFVLLQNHTTTIGFIFFIPAIIATGLAALGVGLWASALSIRYRDLQQILPFLLQLLFFVTPVAYTTQILDNVLPQGFTFLIYLNPMCGIIESFRSALFGVDLNPQAYLSYGMALVLFFTGLFFFQKVEMKIADII